MKCMPIEPMNSKFSTMNSITKLVINLFPYIHVAHTFYIMLCYITVSPNNAPPSFNFKVYAEKHYFITPIEHC